LDASSPNSSAIETKVASRSKRDEPWKKVIAFAMVAIMVAAGFVMLAPALKPNHDKAVSAPQEQASVSIGGPREISTTISNLFETYQKVSGPQSSHSGAPGINSWWPARQLTYGDVVVRSAYPYIIGYGPYSAEVPAAGVAIPTMKYGLYSFYRTTAVANNLTNLGTGAGKEAAFFPILTTPWTTGLGMNGGWMNFSYYLTYCTAADEQAAESGTSYQYSYYGVPGSSFNFGGSVADDGWYIEIQGKLDFDVAAAKKFLGLPGSSDLRTDFTNANTGANLGKLNASLSAFWNRDGSNTGFNDTYASYDYSLDAYPISVFLKLDPSSTSTKLVVRMYSICWGIEYLMNRYLDRAGIASNLVTSPEDWYLNGTVGPGGADISSRYVSVYNLMSWKDPGFYTPSWQIDVVHMDYTPNTALHIGTGGKWLSRFNPYNPTKTLKPTYMAWSPGTLTYGQGVAYWYPPMNWNLASGEKLTVKLPPASQSVMGYTPYLGTGTQDTLTQAKIDELQAHTVWGELGLGTLYPSSLRSNTYYNSATKTLTIVGPTSFPRNPNSAFPLINATGSPNFQFDVMRVSNYTMAMQEAGPYNTGVTYHLQLTAKNVTGATVTDWNGTVDLTATTGTTLGATSLWFGPGSNGVVSTTVTFTSGGAKTLAVTDRNNSLDIRNSIPVTVQSGAATFDLNLVAGWNLISIPILNTYKASTLPGLAVGDLIVEWRPNTQAYNHTYIKGISPAAQNFALNASTGYWMWVASSKVLHLSGTTATGVQTRGITMPASGTGWVTIGFLGGNLTRHARDLPGYCLPTGKVTTVASFDPTLKTYKSWLSAVPTLNNFLLVPGQAYWCFLTSSVVMSYTA
jgi:hypothetical protein